MKSTNQQDLTNTNALLRFTCTVMLLSKNKYSLGYLAYKAKSVIHDVVSCYQDRGRLRMGAANPQAYAGIKNKVGALQNLFFPDL